MALTQLRSSAAHTGRRYGSFAGKEQSRPVGILTQWHAYGTGRRYGSFAGRSPGTVVPPVFEQVGGIPHQPRLPRRFRISAGARQEEEEILLLIATWLQMRH